MPNLTKAFEARLDDALALNAAAGWKPKMFRVKLAVGGFALEEFAAGMDGRPFWKRFEFYTQRSEAERWAKKLAK